MPRDVQEMTAAMCEAFAKWKAKLRAEPPEWRPRGEMEMVPDGYVRA